MVAPTGLRVAIAHEFGHVALKAGAAKPHYLERAQRIAEDLLRDVPIANDETRKRRIGSWALEIAADKIGLDLSLDAAGQEPGESHLTDVSRHFKWCGTEFFF